MRIPRWLDPTDLLAVIARDNKRGYLPAADDQVPMVLLSRLGVPVQRDGHPLVEAPLPVVERVLRELTATDQKPAG